MSPSIAPTPGDAFTGFCHHSRGRHRGSAEPELSLAEVRRILADSGTEILVTDKAVFERNIRDREALQVRIWIQAEDVPDEAEG